MSDEKSTAPAQPAAKDTAAPTPAATAPVTPAAAAPAAAPVPELPTVGEQLAAFGMSAHGQQAFLVRQRLSRDERISVDHFTAKLDAFLSGRV